MKLNFQDYYLYLLKMWCDNLKNKELPGQGRAELRAAEVSNIHPDIELNFLPILRKSWTFVFDQF